MQLKICELNMVNVFKIWLLNLVPNLLFYCHFWSLIGTYFWGFESLIGLYKDPICLRTLCRHSAIMSGWFDEIKDSLWSILYQWPRMFRCNCFRCGDPFNYTLTIEDMPAMMKCEGCCVKLVQHIGTPQYSVRRTCTDNLGKKITFI